MLVLTTKIFSSLLMSLSNVKVTRLSKKMTAQWMNHLFPLGHKVLPDGVTQNRRNLAGNLPLFVHKSNFQNVSHHKFCQLKFSLESRFFFSRKFNYLKYFLGWDIQEYLPNEFGPYWIFGHIIYSQSSSYDSYLTNQVLV